MLRSIGKQSGESVESVPQTGDVNTSTADNPRRTPASLFVFFIFLSSQQPFI